MAKTTALHTYLDIEKQVREGHFAPIYLLMGEEDYYIDKVSAYILDKALKSEERDFNLDLMYGLEARANNVINAARQYPMMAERRVVMVREFQSMPDKEALTMYAKNPNPQTILILCHKHGILEKKKSGAKQAKDSDLFSEITKNGVVMNSARLYEDQLPAFVTRYMSAYKLTLEPQATSMLCEHVGNDLSRLVSEMDKLRLALPNGASTITSKQVEEQTGISKDYNNFELQNALAVRDVLKANKIVAYYHTNPKGFALPMTLSILFGFFTDVMLAYYAPEPTVDSIQKWLGKASAYPVRMSILPARRNYTGVKVMHILSEIRQTDAKSKGVGGCKTPPGELLQELIYFILH